MSGVPVPLTTSPQAGARSRQAGSSQVHLRASLTAPLPPENRLCSIFMYL